MAKTTDQIVRVIIAGGGIIIDAATKSTDQLSRIAIAASNSNVRVTLINADSKTTDQLVRIAMAGKGNIIFDLR